MEITVEEKFESYPHEAKILLIQIREIIYKIAEEMNLGDITEDLKWGEPSYSCKKGSPIRLDWKAKNPNQISIFVNCKTILIETYKEIYGNTFKYVGKRELILPISESLPLPELRGCISMGLQYHKLKKLPLLGA